MSDEEYDRIMDEAGFPPAGPSIMDQVVEGEPVDIMLLEEIMAQYTRPPRKAKRLTDHNRRRTNTAKPFRPPTG